MNPLIRVLCHISSLLDDSLDILDLLDDQYRGEKDLISERILEAKDLIEKIKKEKGEKYALYHKTRD